MWDNSRRFIICVIGLPEEEKKDSTEEIFNEVMAKTSKIWCPMVAYPGNGSFNIKKKINQCNLPY